MEACVARDEYHVNHLPAHEAQVLVVGSVARRFVVRVWPSAERRLCASWAMARKPRKGFYAVRVGRKPGVYETWEECRAQVDRYPNARFRGFPTLQEAEAFVKERTAQKNVVQAEHGLDSLPPGSKTRAATAPSHKPPSASLPTKALPAASMPSTTAPQPAAAPLPSAVSSLPLVEAPLHSDSETLPIRRSGSDEDSENPVMVLTDEEVLSESPSLDTDNGPTTYDVYTDGSSVGNGSAGAMAGFGVFWADKRMQHLNVSQRLVGEVQSNNRAELQALIAALERAPNDDKPLRLFTDSQYAIRCVSEWLPGWRRTNWKTKRGTDVLNKDLIQQLDKLFRKRRTRPVLVHVRGHSGIHGNTMADMCVHAYGYLPRLANQGARDPCFST